MIDWREAACRAKASKYQELGGDVPVSRRMTMHEGVDVRRGTGSPAVIVAGGGPTGLWLGCELALADVEGVGLERLPEPTGFSKALGLQSRTMEVLDHRGILDRFTVGNPAVPFLNFGMIPLD